MSQWLFTSKDSDTGSGCQFRSSTKLQGPREGNPKGTETEAIKLKEGCNPKEMKLKEKAAAQKVS